MTFAVGQVVVGNRRALQHPAKLEVQRGEWVVLDPNYLATGRVLVRSLGRRTSNGDMVEFSVQPWLICSPEERVAEELME